VKPHADGSAPRLLIVPGLHDSGPAHWQTWLHALHPDALRVRQDDWSVADLERWADRIGETLEGVRGPVIAVAHSFGCLALAQLLGWGESRIAAALLVAPADPQRFGLQQRLHAAPLGARTTLIASDTDPWMSADEAQRWARRWGSHVHNLGDAGHINAESGFGPLPLAAQWVRRQRQQHSRVHRAEHASLAEWSFAI
jgi:predicted alpha/beta hydrolase family esterase